MRDAGVGDMIVNCVYSGCETLSFASTDAEGKIQFCAMKLTVGEYLNQHCLCNLKSVANGCEVSSNGHLKVCL